jgi:hypothetical protein
MKKFLLAALLAGVGWLCPAKARANQFALPQETSTTTYSVNASLVLSTPTVSNAMNCIQHLTITSLTAGTTFDYLTNGTTIYSFGLSSGVPFDSQWTSQSAMCGSPGQQTTAVVAGGVSYIISAEAFTTKGWSP